MIDKCVTQTCGYHTYYAPQGGAWSHEHYHFFEQELVKYNRLRLDHMEYCEGCNGKLCPGADTIMEMIGDLEGALDTRV